MEVEEPAVRKNRKNGRARCKCKNSCKIAETKGRSSCNIQWSLFNPSLPYQGSFDWDNGNIWTFLCSFHSGVDICRRYEFETGPRFGMWHMVVWNVSLLPVFNAVAESNHRWPMRIIIPAGTNDIWRSQFSICTELGSCSNLGTSLRLPHD